MESGFKVDGSIPKFAFNLPHLGSLVLGLRTSITRSARVLDFSFLLVAIYARSINGFNEVIEQLRVYIEFFL